MFVLVFFVFGLCLMAMGIRMGAEGWQAGKWPVAEGRMITSRVKEFRTSGNIRVARLCLELDYLYMIGDRILDGSRLDAGWRCCGSEKMINEKLAAYPPGKALEVYYNPRNPEISMLEPGIPWPAMLLCGTGLVIFSVIWPFLRFRLKMRRD